MEFVVRLRVYWCLHATYSIWNLLYVSGYTGVCMQHILYGICFTSRGILVFADNIFYMEFVVRLRVYWCLQTTYPIYLFFFTKVIQLVNVVSEVYCILY